MSFYVNNTELQQINFNGNAVNSAYFNNVLIWNSFNWVGWNNATWEDIYNLCKAKQEGKISAWPSDVVVGATKITTLSTAVLGSSSFTMRLIGIDEDGDGLLTFESSTTTVDGVNYNDISPIYYYGNLADIHSYCDAKNYTKTVSKVFTYPGGLSDKTYSCNMWILSVDELGAGGGGAYSYYASGANSLRKKNAAYWTRTANNDTLDAYSISTTGALTQTNNLTETPIAPAFVIG